MSSDIVALAVPMALTAEPDEKRKGRDETKKKIEKCRPTASKRISYTQNSKESKGDKNQRRAKWEERLDA